MSANSPLIKFYVLFFALVLPASALAGKKPAINHFDRIDLAAPMPAGENVLGLRAFGNNWRLRLNDNRKLFGRLNADAVRALRAGDDRFFAGSIDGIDGSWVRLNWIDGAWSGGFYDGTELYLVDRRGSLELPAGRSAAPGQLIAYRFSDLELGDVIGHEPLIAAPARPATSQYGGFIDHLREVAQAGEALFLMPITVVTDANFGATFGASTASTVAGRTNFIDGIYSSQLGTGITLFHHEPLTGNGTLTATDAQDLLEQFGDFMRSGAGSAIPFQGLAHLFTSRTRDGNTAGIAYLGALCNSSFGFGVDWNLSNETTNSLVYAHEVGHNFNAPHDGFGACANETFEGIMNPSINGSQQFSACSLQEMGNEVATAGCLIENPDSGAVFADGFEPNA
ncbi:MAG: M12 family metallo-peptidase [Wenzhouxiangellaceae bacterium]|nr:M12 family metallo-peptidase [Wenzhouxiangellaceae bacterium]